MDGQRFDALARTLSSRRTAIGGLLSALALVPLDAAARKKGKHRKGSAKRRVTAQESCWRAGACIVSKGSNVSQCDLAGYTAPNPLDCTRCNLSRANLREADLTGVNFTRANLSGACLVNADFTGATFTNATNLYGAIFCRTILPDGSTNNSGCGSGTACCPTCVEEGGACGAGIGGSCCGSAQCTNGVCQSCTPANCPSPGTVCGVFPDGCGQTQSCLCGFTATPSCNNGTCTSCGALCGGTCRFCANLTNGTTQCYSRGLFSCSEPCATNADCPAGKVCVSSTSDGSNQSTSLPQICGQTSLGICNSFDPCTAG